MKGWFYSVKSWPLEARITRYSATALAKWYGISQRALQRHFKDVYKMKLHQWLRDLRLADARRLLAPGKLVKEVAGLLHYQSTQHFARDFKKQYGFAPQEAIRRGSTVTSAHWEYHLVQLQKLHRP